LDGTEPVNMLDNLTITRTNHIVLQEDPGKTRRSAKVFLYDITAKTLTELAHHDPARFGDLKQPGQPPFNAGVDGKAGTADDFDEESSGVIDMAEIFGPGWFLLDVQAHYTGGIAPGLVEGGQLLAMFVPQVAEAYSKARK